MMFLALFMISAEPTPAEHIERGRAALDDLDYEVAALELTLAAQDARATEEERIEANLYAGIANRILGRDTDARLNFVYVLRRRPETKLPPDTPPKISAFFDLVREEIGAPEKPPTKPPEPQPQPPPQVQEQKGSIVPGVLTIGGGVIAASGVVAGIVGSLPYFDHANARAELDALASQGADGTAAQQRQHTARANWESWGLLTSTVGFVAAGVGVIGAGVGAAMWIAE